MLIYRAGDPRPSNLKLRPGEEMLSFRSSLSNPFPLIEGQRPVFRLGERWFAIDAALLPSGSVFHDSVPEGHVSVYDVNVQLMKDAVVVRGRMPKQ